MAHPREEELSIATDDGFLLYGTLTNAVEKSEKLVIFVHGFTGHRHEHIFFNGARFFAERGFDSYRFNLYGEGAKARHLRSTKISTHGADVTTLVKHFREQYKKIYLVGHSFGGPSVLISDTSLIDGIALWDASYIDSEAEALDFVYNDKLDAHILDWGIEHIVGKEYVEELKNLPDCGELVAKAKVPILIISAGQAGDNNKEEGERYFAAAQEPKKLVHIAEADHNFDSFETEKQLLEETYEWFAAH